jgi:uncharacterized membrane protein
MGKDEVSLREYFDLKFNAVDDKLTNLHGFVKDYYEESCKRIEKVEDEQKKLRKQTSFSRWAQAHWLAVIIILAVFIILVTNLSIVMTFFTQSGLAELIKIVK